MPLRTARWASSLPWASAAAYPLVALGLMVGSMFLP